MSGHWRFCVAAFLLFAGLSTLPAFSNPLDDLFNPAPKEAAPPPPAPAPAKEACVSQPGNSTAPGQHWFYRVDGHRKCWFQAAAATASVNRPIHHHAAKQPVITAEDKKQPVITPEEKKQPVMAPEENEAASRKTTVLDARAQLLNAATADASQSIAPAPKMVDSAAAPDNAAETPVPAAPIPAQPTIDRLVPDHTTPRSVDVETLLAASSLDTVSSSVPPAAAAPSIADADKGHSELTVTRAGMVLIVLGLVFLVGSLLASLFLDPGVAPIRRA